MYPGGLRHIRPDRRINEWRAPGRKTISRAATNERQVAIALSGGEVVYFELNPQVGGWAVFGGAVGCVLSHGIHRQLGACCRLPRLNCMHSHTHVMHSPCPALP